LSWLGTGELSLIFVYFRIYDRILEQHSLRVAGVTLGGNPAIIATEVKKGDEVLKLRDDAGFPVWSGWRETLGLAESAPPV
jgi:hypothetical protein